MIETGVESGFSTEHFVTAMDRAGTGHLFSCDPTPSGFYDANPIVHPRFTFIRERSQEALPKIYASVGLFDIFLHDSDHSWECASWEYEFAWKHVRSGGIIASDDTGWGVNTVSGTIAHEAWGSFCLRHGITQRNKINNAEWIRRP
jgi:predicted O-methyltransferase YrrM